MKIWLYYAKSGGGHKAPAEALASDLKRLYPGTETKLIDMADQASVFFRLIIENGYVLLVQNLTWIYAVIYTINNSRLVVKLENFLTNLFLKSLIKARLVVDKPSGVVSTHFLVSPISSALKDLKMDIPIYIIVTDPFSVSPIWFYNKNLHYIVYSDAAKQIALANGVSPEKVVVFHQIVNHPTKILLAEEVAKVKNKYQINERKKIILMIGGANGLPKGEKIFELILKNKINAEVVAVCGTNKRQAKNFHSIKQKYNSEAKIMGWVDNLSELMGAADLVITKAGAGVIYESLLLQKPLLITHFIFGQEKGTMEFVVKNGLGWYFTDSELIIKKVKDVIDGEDGKKILMANEKIKFRSGNEEIVNYLYRSISEQRLD
ncbi:MAG: glycosyltransferase [Patescibacteria group bacterium]|jgi:processive 1,2-diacylglycerol beta-glucosyltransferase/1,2-diacylglycerol 3-beta-galactosyltransferase